MSHNCFAWRIGDANVRSSDDGEPSGTAGIPILNVLHGKKEKLEFDNIVAMVTRYYGGTKLGPGGLMRAYGGAVSLAFETLDLENDTQLKAAKVVAAASQMEESRRRGESQSNRATVCERRTGASGRQGVGRGHWWSQS